MDQSAQPERRDEGGEPTFFAHIHVPKTGGSAFNAVLAGTFGRSFEMFGGRFVSLYPALSTAQVSSFISRHPGIEAAASHKFSALLPYQTAEKRIIALSLVREPVERFFSYYFHMRHRYGVACPEKEYKLDDYVSFMRERTETNLPGYLERYVGSESDLAFEYVKTLSDNDHLYLFSTDRMREAVAYLGTRFPTRFKDLPIKRENVSIKDQSVTGRHREIVAEFVSPFDRKVRELVRV